MCAALLVVAVIGVVATVGCGSEPTPPVEGQGDSAESALREALPQETASGQVAAPRSENQVAYGAQSQVVRVETNIGAISIQLDVENAPGTVHNFLRYVSEGFYDNTLFHFVDPENMILGGGYSSEHQPKSPIFAPIWSEAHNGRKNLRGTIAMARDASVVDSATSQFYINLADSPQRDHTGDSPEQYGYCVFGDVIEGMDVADQIGDVATQNRGGELAQSPQSPVVITSIRIL